MSGDDIERRYGAGGPRDFIPVRFGSVQGVGLITDDTQMTMFSVEGIIRASVRARQRGLGFTVGVVQHAYLRWLDTQLLPAPPPDVDGWLAQERWLFSRRAPGTTCLSALDAANRDQFGEAAVNNSKGCGAVMRSAPFGFLPVWDPPEDEFRFECAATAAGYTHGHPTGQLAARGLAYIIAAIVAGATLPDAIDVAIRRLDVLPRSAETTTALRQAVALAHDGEVSRQAVESLGGGWVAEEALAIAVYCALSRAEPAQLVDALALAVTHSGDSDSTGAICGNILGTLHGEAAVPTHLSERVEGRDALLTLADDMATEFTHSPDAQDADLEAWWHRYPGW
ncbi:MAG: ADP-ribosylglycohydrolase family protein [Actinomycetota bacterium]|nr:ADP-ribosylglycohydrolase family protein [Actinomycetota bacterium]